MHPDPAQLLSNIHIQIVICDGHNTICCHFLWDFENFWLAESKKASQSLRPQTQKIEIIFHRDMCVGKNTSQAASVEFVRHRRTNYARSRLQSFCRKIPKEFSTVLKALGQPAEGCFYWLLFALAGLYKLRQFAVGLPVKTSDGQVAGMVLAMIDGSQLMRLWRSFTGLFFMISAIVLLIAFVASSFMSMRQIQPIKEMLKGTRAYAAGNFDMRIEDEGRSDEIGELARSFNMMADSLLETERQRRDFIANISHELKTPMTSIAGYTDGILDGTIPQKDERKYLQIISDESHRLSRLVRRMLDISQIQSQEMHKEDFDLCESMRIALLSMEQKINQRGLDVEADIPEDSVMVQGVNDLITQVIYNLLENATKFAAPGSTLYLGLTETGGDKAVVTVRNTGHTIPPEEIPLLFERFHKSDKSRSEDKDGYGLGLYVVKTILSQHKEKISVTSENGVTSFSFTVQLAHPMRNT